MARQYDIAKTSGLCGACGRELSDGEEFVAVVFEDGQEFRRRDLCPACWEAGKGGTAGAFSFWRARMPRPDGEKKPPVDNGVLVDFFNRLEGHEEPAKICFRFVLALMLMRKKLLVYEGSDADPAGQEVWSMRFKHDQTPVEVVRPHLDEARIAEVSAQLGALFEGST